MIMEYTDHSLAYVAFPDYKYLKLMCLIDSMVIRDGRYPNKKEIAKESSSLSHLLRHGVQYGYLYKVRKMKWSCLVKYAVQCLHCGRVFCKNAELCHIVLYYRYKEYCKRHYRKKQPVC